MSDEERPVHVTVDCSGISQKRAPVVTSEPVTDEEWAEMKARDEAAAEDERIRAAEDERIRAAVAAHPDALVRLLAARAGLA